jgi:Homeodomain-like domain
MTPPLYVRPLTPEAKHYLETRLRSSEAFALRRCQIVLASARGQRPARIARNLGCATQSVRSAAHAFRARGTCGGEGTVPPSTTDSLRAGCWQVRATSSPVTRMSAHLRQALEHVDAPFGPGGLLRGRVTPYQVSFETSRKALKRLGVNWRRAKRWITSPDPQYARKRSAAARTGRALLGWQNAYPVCHHRGGSRRGAVGRFVVGYAPDQKRPTGPSPLCGGLLPKVTSQPHSPRISVSRRYAWARAVARRRTPSRMAGIGTDAYPSSRARCSDGSR